MAVNQLLITSPITSDLTSDEHLIVAALMIEGLRLGFEVDYYSQYDSKLCYVNAECRRLTKHEVQDFIFNVHGWWNAWKYVTVQSIIQDLISIIYDGKANEQRYRSGSCIVWDDFYFDVNPEHQYPDVLSRKILMPGMRKSGRKDDNLIKGLQRGLQALEESGCANEAAQRKARSLQAELRKLREKETPTPDNLSDRKSVV